ncbi:thiol reductant ABC exporter subunit CydC [Actinoplanes sp. CA-054009]
MTTTRPTTVNEPAAPKRSASARGPLDPRLVRHARTSRAGIVALALLGAGQAAATLTVAVALTLLIAGDHRWATALLAGAFAARAALSWAEQVVAQRTAARVTDELRRSMLAAVLRRGPAWVASFGAGRLTAVLTNGLDALRPWFSGYLPSLVLGVALPPLVIVTMALVDTASAVIALVTLPLIPVLGALIGWATQARARRRWQADARLAGHFLDVVRGLPALRVFGRAERQTAVVADLTDKHRSATLRVLRVAFLSSTALDLVGTLSVGLIAVEAGLRVAAGDLPLGPALLVILLAPEAYRPLREMAAKYHAATDATAVINDVDEILTPTDATPLTTPATTATGTTSATRAAASTTSPHDQLPREIGGETSGSVGVGAFGLRVRYPGAARDALALDELAVRAGEIVALRGPSGAGKTTALRVLAGLQAPHAGVAIADKALYLPQRVTLPHARTVTDLFPSGTSATEIREALRTVGLDLPADTALGERGAGVSAGQRHRLALAALLHRAGSEPVTLLLDEPTAHLDAATEQLVIERLRAAARQGSAVLVVAHRPALLAAADRITDVAPPTEGPLTGAFAAPTGATAAGPVTEADKGHATGAGFVPVGNAPGASWRTFQGARRSGVEGWPVWRRPWAAVVLGSASSLAGIVLTGAAAWLLVRASSLPPVLSLSTAVVLVRGSAVARPLLRYLERLVAHDVAFARLGAWRSRVYAALIPRVPGPRLRRRGDLLTKVVDDVDARVDGLLRGRLPAWAAALTIAVASAVALLLSPGVAVPLAAGLVIAGVVAPLVAARQATRSEAATGEARAQLRDAMVETVEGIEELTGSQAVPERRSRELARLEERSARAAGWAAALGHLGWGLAVTGTAFALGGLTHEWAAVLLLAMVVLGEQVMTLPDAAVARRRAAGAEQRLTTLLAEPPTVTFPHHTSATAEPPRSTHSAAPDAGSGEPGTGATTTPDADRGDAGTGADLGRGGAGALGVRLEGLVAGWDPERAAVLDGLDLDLVAGSRVAVLGRSGSGKSTLAAVVGRLLDPRAGALILSDGTDLRELPEEAVRGRIVLVGDETDHVFASTVRENLRLAKPGATDGELRAVLERVRLGGWLDGLTDGLDTWLGSGGSTMSGGQVRRFATARALLAEPGLLILDEPTEGLDADVAEALMADLLDAGRGRTVLVLTHRTEGLDRVDQILTLANGRLTETNHHVANGRLTETNYRVADAQAAQPQGHTVEAEEQTALLQGHTVEAEEPAGLPQGHAARSHGQGNAAQAPGHSAESHGQRPAAEATGRTGGAKVQAVGVGGEEHVAAARDLSAAAVGPSGAGM